MRELLLAGLSFAALALSTSDDVGDASGGVCLQSFLDVSGPRVSGPTWRALEAAGDLKFDPQTGDYRIYWMSPDGARKSWIFEPAGKVKVRVEAEVTQDASGAYLYRYTVHNLDSSPQNLNRFMVRYDGAEIYDIAQAGELWWFSPQVSRLGTPEAVVSWSARLRPEATEEDVPGIPPGRSASGFGFTSRQPPGMVTCYARGCVRGVTIMDPNPEAAPDPRPLPGLLSDCAVGATVGPVPETRAKLAEGYIILGYANALAPETTEVFARSGERTLCLLIGSQEVLVDGESTTLARPTLVDEEGHLAVSADLLDTLSSTSASMP